MLTEAPAPPTPVAADPPLTPAERLSLAWGCWRLRLTEFALYDSAVCKALLGLAGFVVGYALYLAGARRRGFTILSKLHRSAFLGWVSRRVERLPREAAEAYRVGKPHPLHRVYAEHVADLPPTPANQQIFRDPARLLQGNAIVLKPAGPNERGVLLLYYSYTYPLFARYFDLEAIARRYFLVLEPSWSGLCDLDLLHLTRLREPVFVGTMEPRDAAFLEGLNANFIPVAFGNNTWVDHRVFRPLPDTARDIDLLVVAGWAPYKRHWALFAALRRYKDRGHRPRVVLVGYSIRETRQHIEKLASYHGVRDLIEIHELLPPAQVNALMSRARVNLLWSRREGSNRTIVEGMLADAPCILRAGHNYGHPYAHVNPRTGRFADEATLPDVLGEMLADGSGFGPREWVMEHMAAEVTTRRLNEVIRQKSLELGETWTRGLVVKVNELNSVRYWDPEDEKRFAADYEFLRSAILGSD